MSKRTGEDCSILIGLTNPYAFELHTYAGYNIDILQDSFRMLEIVLARKGKANGLCPLYFNGAINKYLELPLPKDTQALEVFYKQIDKINNK